MRRTCICLILLLPLISCTKGTTRGWKTKEDLASHYVEAINNKDLVKLKGMYHPKCLENITEQNKDFFDSVFEEELSRSIPLDRHISYEAIDTPDDLPFSDAFEYVTKPTHKMKIRYKKSKHYDEHSLSYISETPDGWFLVLPLPKTETLIEFRNNRKREKEEVDRVAKIIEAMDKSTYGNIVEQLKQEGLLRAVSVYESAYGKDKTTAILVVKEIKRREGL